MGIVKETNLRDFNPEIILPGTVFVNEKTCKKYGASFFEKNKW